VTHSCGRQGCFTPGMTGPDYNYIIFFVISRHGEDSYIREEFLVDAMINLAAKRHKIHKKNNLHIRISNSYGRQKYKFGLFTRPS